MVYKGERQCRKEKFKVKKGKLKSTEHGELEGDLVVECEDGSELKLYIWISCGTLGVIWGEQ